MRVDRRGSLWRQSRNERLDTIARGEEEQLPQVVGGMDGVAPGGGRLELDRVRQLAHARGVWSRKPSPIVAKLIGRAEEVGKRIPDWTYMRLERLLDD